jgi:hypothetical protein
MVVLRKEEEGTLSLTATRERRARPPHVGSAGWFFRYLKEAFLLSAGPT